MLQQKGNRRWGRRWIQAIVAVMAAVALAGPDGTITALSATDAPNPGQTISLTPLPATLSGSLYLHNDPSPPVGDTNSHATLPMGFVAPSVGSLFNYDTNRDAFAGLLIQKGGTGFTDTDPMKHQRWRSEVFAVTTAVSGAPQLVFWSAMKDFKDQKRGAVAAYLVATDGTTAAWSVSGSVQRANWQGGSASWVETPLTFDAPAPSLIPAGSWLELVLVVENSSDDDMWFAYDTATFPTRVMGFALAAEDGTIVALSATDAPNPGQTITISATLSATATIPNSNVYYQIIAPDGVTVVATHTTSIPSMQAGDTIGDSWTTTNTSFPTAGTYTLIACWSTDNAANCDIDQKTTGFYSVPTLGGWLSLAGLALLAWFLWRRRADFRVQAAKS